MSVLIRGMDEIPEDGAVLVVKHDDNGKVYIKYAGMMGYSMELVKITGKHGRLIDVDELIEDLKHDVAIDQDSLDYEELTEINRRLIQGDKDIKQNAIDLLEHTRCIIEAEGAEE